MIIGLVGLKGSGKDTVAAYLIKNHGFERKAFADPLKRSLAAFLDIPYHEIESFKNSNGAYVTTIYDDEPVKVLTFREALQRYGTESHRDIFGETFWLEATLPVGGFYKGRAIVVTDVRFENEAERIELLGGYIVRIERESATLSEQDPHRSEGEQLRIQTPFIIKNNDTIDDLHSEVDNMLIRLHR
jgi:Deoxynucleotide monophosphate kinase